MDHQIIQIQNVVAHGRVICVHLLINLKIADAQNAQQKEIQ